MEKKLNQLKNLRLFVLRQIDGLTSEQLNLIPEGYNNNIIWNLGHLVAASQAICYIRAGLPVTIDDKYFFPFLTNTKPVGFLATEEIEVIKGLSISTLDALQSDIESNIFINYRKSENIERVYGIELLSIEDAIDFLLYHEGFHTGYIAGLKRLL
jgi:hypothetical protein